MRLAFCFSRNCRPYPTILVLRSLPCWPGAKLRFSTGHLSLKHFEPFRNNFIPSRRQSRQTAPLILAICFFSYSSADRFTGWQPFFPVPLLNKPSTSIHLDRRYETHRRDSRTDT